MAKQMAKKSRGNSRGSRGREKSALPNADGHFISLSLLKRCDTGIGRENKSSGPEQRAQKCSQMVKRIIITIHQHRSVENEKCAVGPGQGAHGVRASSQCTKVAGHLREATSECVDQQNDQLMFLSVSLPRHLSLESINK